LQRVFPHGPPGFVAFDCRGFVEHRFGGFLGQPCDFAAIVAFPIMPGPNVPSVECMDESNVVAKMSDEAIGIAEIGELLGPPRCVDDPVEIAFARLCELYSSPPQDGRFGPLLEDRGVHPWRPPRMALATVD
jgi:hypothetical protein